MKTSYFSFCGHHVHRHNDITFDVDLLVKITDEDPRRRMFEIFNDKWGFEYNELPDLRYFPRGIYDLTNNYFIDGVFDEFPIVFQRND